MRILVTGGTGGLGRTLMAAAREKQHAVRATCRHEPSDGDVEWVRADLVTGEGLARAVNGVEVVVHAASDPKRAEIVDVGGTKKLLEVRLAPRTSRTSSTSRS
jgi:nucleoside-diphosphate-sugar epimerase